MSPLSGPFHRGKLSCYNGNVPLPLCSPIKVAFCQRRLFACPKNKPHGVAAPHGVRAQAASSIQRLPRGKNSDTLLVHNARPAVMHSLVCASGPVVCLGNSPPAPLRSLFNVRRLRAAFRVHHSMLVRRPFHLSADSIPSNQLDWCAEKAGKSTAIFRLFPSFSSWAGPSVGRAWVIPGAPPMY